MTDKGLCECGCGGKTKPAPHTDKNRGWIKGQPLRFIHGHAPRGRKQSKEHVEKRMVYHRGVKKGPLSEETKRKLSIAGRGRTVPQERRERIAAAQRGELSPFWRGDEAAYVTKHRWMLRNFTKTGSCEICGAIPPTPKGRQTGTHWANKNHEYRRDLVRIREDWIELCPKCHKAYDKAMKVAGASAT